MGRRRVPTALRIARGNPRQKPISQDEPKPKLGATPPDGTSERARRYWKKLGERLNKVGILTEADSASFEVCCEIYARWRKAEHHLRDHGLTVRGKSGRELPSPYNRIANTAAGQLFKYLTAFGMTPSGRASVRGVKSDAPQPKKGRLKGLDEEDEEE